jgi:integrase
MSEKRMRGTGHVYQRGNVYWVKYSRNGKAFAESAKTNDREKAEKFLQRRLAQVITGTFVGPRAEKIRVSELAEDFLRDYRINGKKSLDDAETRWTLHLKPVFGHLRAVQVSTDHFNKYVDDRQQAGASNATINRELAALKRMFTLGAQTTPQKVTRIPHFPHLAERNVRKGFVEDSQYTAMAKACAEIGLWLRGLFECGYTYGWRISELLGLRVNQINVVAGTILLNPGETKNDEARLVKMSAGVKVLLTALIAGKQPGDFVFTREGEVVRDFRMAWETVTTAAGVPDLLFHDLRRTAVRNMVRAGIPERVAMSISGHKTRSVFERYNIVSERDLDDAVRKLEVRRETVTKQLQSEAERVPATPASSVN